MWRKLTLRTVRIQQEGIWNRSETTFLEKKTARKAKTHYRTLTTSFTYDQHLEQRRRELRLLTPSLFFRFKLFMQYNKNCFY